MGEPINADENPNEQVVDNIQVNRLERATHVGHADYIGVVENLNVGVHHHHHAPQQQANTEADHLIPTPSSSHQHERTLKESADVIQQHQLKKLGSQSVLRGLNVNRTELPDVVQVLVESNIFEVKELPKNEPFIASTQEKKNRKLETSNIIPFNNLLTTMISVGFLALVGPPGCGKTTLAKRLAKSANFFVIFLRFMDLGYNLVLTPRELLIDFPFKDIDQTIRDNAFEWMLKNQDKCVFVFDGYDQSSWALGKENPPDVSYETSLPIQQLVANFCCKNFFRNSLLVFTSRYHTIRSIPSRTLRPKTAVIVGDLPTDGMKKLFLAYAGDQGDRLWITLSSNAPQLIELCRNPLLLQFVVFAGLHGNVNKINTTTKVFIHVLLQLEYSSHKQGLAFNELVKPLGEMAYDAMVRQTVVFTRDDLNRAGLKDVNVQDFVIEIAFCPTLFDGDNSVFCFTHQMLQEMFAASYICNVMPDSMFNQIIHQVVYKSHWSMVRRFTCGLLLNDESKNSKTDQFRSELIKFIDTTALSRNQMLDLLTDIQECSDEEKDILAKYFPSQFDFFSTPITSSALRGLAQILPRLNRPVGSLNFSSCNLTCASLTLICAGIKEMKHEVHNLDLRDNKFGDEGIRIITGCANHLTKLWVEGCGVSDDGKLIISDELERIGIPKKQAIRVAETLIR